MQTYLGIDAGGSGSRWALLAADGTLLSSGDDGPAIQVAEIGATVAAGRVAELLQELTARHASSARAPVVVGLAGVSGGGVRQELEASLSTAGRRVRIVEDTITGAAAALADGPGLALFAGTGSFAVARDIAGQLHRVGGRGSIASDHGSAYRVVRDAVEVALLAADGIGAATTLGEFLCAELDAPSVEALGLALKVSSTRGIARVFPVVVAAADAGDVEADRILRRAAGTLSRLARGAAARAGLDPARCPVTLGGGTMAAAAYFRCVQQALIEDRFTGTIRALPMRPAQGAAHLARAAACDEAPMCSWVEG